MDRGKRWKLEAVDRLRYNPLVREAAARYLSLTSGAAPNDQQALVRSIVKLCTAIRCTTNATKIRAYQAAIHERLRSLKPKEVDWKPYVPRLDDPTIRRSVLLKPYVGPHEKGVIYIAFEVDWFKLLLHCDLKTFSDRYDLVLSPTDSVHSVLNYVFAANYPGRIYSVISHESDIAELPTVAANYVAIPLYASHWVMPELLQPKPLKERDVDLIMVANFAKVKRHLALFAALRGMPSRFKVLLIGQDQDGRTEETLRKEAAYYGVADRFTVQSNVPDYLDVGRALCRARASVILTRREGSCVVVAESMFANTPVGLLRDAEIGSRVFINEATGRFLDHRHLGQQLTELIERAGEYSPRAWAEKNIGCHQSSGTLNDLLRQHALKDGQEWTQDIAPLCWRPTPELVRQEDVVRLQPEREEIKRRFGVVVGPWLAG
jgi:glycosyltransferase involved in cell wall biosynthesis